MPRLLPVVLVVAALAAPRPAATAPLAHSGTLEVFVATLPGLAVPGSGVAVVNPSAGLGGPLTGVTLAGGDFAGGLTLPVTDPFAAPIAGIQMTVANQAGAFAGSPLAGAMPLGGIFRICILVPCTATFGPANISVPLSPVGGGGTAYGGSAANVTVFGAPWTTGTLNLGALTVNGFAHGPLSASTSAATASGVVQLVTPIFVSTSIPASATIPAFARLTLEFVPEPGTALLLGLGVLALAWRGRQLSR